MIIIARAWNFNSMSTDNFFAKIRYLCEKCYWLLVTGMTTSTWSLINL